MRNQFGPPRLLNDIDINLLSYNLKKANGISIGDDESRDKIIENQKIAVEERLLVPIMIVDFKPSKMTLTNYWALVAHQSGVSITSKVIKKTPGRYTAENSLISAMALLCVVACTHYMPALDYQQDIEEEMKSAPPGVLKLFRCM